MEFELLDDQAVQYTYLNGTKYGEKGSKQRLFKNVKKGAAADALANVGQAIAGLQGDELGAAVLIQHQSIPLPVKPAEKAQA